jgi:carbon-monoxide dehydrogenase large subunit
MEPRTAIGVFDQETQRYVLYACGGIGVTRLRVELSTVLGVPLERTRVITPQDVGGNFGTRNAFHPEFALLPWMAERLGRPVKHLVERSEAFISDYQGRDLFVEAELALDAEGRFLAIKSSNLSNVGAHTASFVPLNKGVQLMTSVYAIPAAHIRARAVLSNTPSTIPYRSAGRPEAIFAVERLIDLAAHEGGFDRIELRRKNLIAPEAMPYKNAFGITYDNGNYADTMMATVEAADWAGFPARRAEAARRGKLRGIGVANYVETAGGMPRERADIVVSPEGRVDAVLGTAPTGQSHETTFAQLMSDWLGVDFDEVTVRFGDTDIVHAGGGSHSGRSMRFASIVIKAATDEIIAKGKEIAAARLEVAAADIEFADGRFVVAGTDRGMTLYEAAAAAEKGEGLPAPLRGRLAATSDQMIGGLAFPFGSHVCEVEIDPETGRLTVVRHTCIDDVGRAVNPMVVEGQSHGGIVQGMGQALMEQCVMDPETGQPLAGSFMDYEIPRADEFPMMDARFAELPATSHPLGLRPGGEGGTTPALAVAINAVVDALSPLGVIHFEMPATPYRIWRVIQDAKARPSPKG